MVLRPESRKPYVYEALDDLAEAHPTAFLATVLEIIHTNHSDDVMSKVSGPLQMLLDTDPEKVIGQVEDLAKRDVTFRELLGWFIPSEPNGPVWKRVRDVAGDVPW